MTTTPVCVPPCVDLCPENPEKMEPSVCGCYPDEYCQNCTIFLSSNNCEPVNFSDTQNTSHPTVVTFPPDSPGVDMGVELPDNTTMHFSFSWGAIREVEPNSNLTIKGIEVSAINWTRQIWVEPALLTATLSTMIFPHGDFHHPFNVTLTTTFVRDPAGANFSDFSTSSLKLSLTIGGEWGFVAPENELHVDFSFQGPFAPNDCGETFKVKEKSPDFIYFDVYTKKRSTFQINFLRYCFADEIKHPAQVKNPNIRQDRASFLLVCPSFSSSLFYDPSFALLLGRRDNACKTSLFYWILPVSFILGALVISLLICFIGSLPFALPFVKGKEGHRIHRLRITTARHMKTQSDV